MTKHKCKGKRKAIWYLYSNDDWQIEKDNDGNWINGNWIIQVNDEYATTINYCPFCGERFNNKKVQKPKKETKT